MSVVCKQESSRWRLSATHINHGISPFANQWEDFCRGYCARLGVPLTSLRVSVERGSKDGLEAAARRARYAALRQVDADWMMLAHQQDDQAETLLFNLIRGTGLAGAAAMRECSGRLLRPWLSVRRVEIESYARFHGLDWCEDESNTDVRHSRNFLRRCIFPELKRRFPAATKNLAGASLRFAESQKLLDDLARLDLSKGHDGFPVEVNLLAALDELRARNVLRYLLALSGVQIPSEARLKEALRQMLDAGHDRHPVIVLGNHLIRRHKGSIYLEPPGDICERR